MPKDNGSRRTNPHRGDTNIEVGGQTYCLCFDMNACSLIMEQLGVETFEALAEKAMQQGMGISEVRYILWAGLQRHHPDLTEKDVGAMEWDLPSLGDFLGPAFERALTRMSPPEVDGDVEKKARRSRGTGKRRGSVHTKRGSPQASSGP